VHIYCCHGQKEKQKEAKETFTPGGRYHIKFLEKKESDKLACEPFFSLWFDENEPLHFKSQKQFYNRL
jgi:hypothetical protein